VAVEKLLLGKFAQIKIVSGCPRNDFLSFPRHYLSPKLLLFGRKWSFSTPTLVNASHHKIVELIATST
jgi:hypothetical protein